MLNSNLFKLALSVLWIGAVPEAGMAAPVDWESQRAGATRSASVYWVGHSLMEGKADINGKPESLLTLVGHFANQRGLAYRAGDHTRFGSSLAGLWRGAPHTYSHKAVAGMEKVRKQFESEAGLYDALVATEVIPVKAVRKIEYSSYYLRRFFCTLRRVNPSARVFVYETWVHLYGLQSHYGPPEAFDWLAQMREQQKEWEALADEASSPNVDSPPLFWRIRLWGKSDGGCSDSGPIFTIPVGRAFVSIADRLAKPRPADIFALPEGRSLEMADLFLNPYRSQPSGHQGKSTEQRKPRDEAKELDDIHMGSVGLYVSALVHFATLYRQTPVGLAPLRILGDEVSRTLQCIAWETVIGTPRSGVRGSIDC